MEITGTPLSIQLKNNIIPVNTFYSTIKVNHCPHEEIDKSCHDTHKRKNITKKIREEIFNMYNGNCFYCDIELNNNNDSKNDDFEVEHVIPRSSGGPDDISNYVPSCANCNKNGKKTMDVIEFCNDGKCPAVANINIKICDKICTVKKYHKDTNKLLVKTETDITNGKIIINNNYEIEDLSNNLYKTKILDDIKCQAKIASPKSDRYNQECGDNAKNKCKPNSDNIEYVCNRHTGKYYVIPLRK